MKRINTLNNYMKDTHNEVNLSQSNIIVEKVGLYVRISEQDRVKLTKAQLSKSIENQLAMLKTECKERGWVIADIYCDEDISGADQTRPEFNRLLKDCEEGKINVVLCKSQDRFARDMEMIEKYVHNKFIEWGVRFVTIIDHADTDIKENKKNRQITGLTNEWYLEDLSNNIKTTFNAKRKNGDFVGSFAPYGYTKERDLKNALHLVIDPIPAEIIKRIFKEYAEGSSCRAIARGLNEDKIPSPSEYKWGSGKHINTPVKIVTDKIFKNSGGYIIKSSFFNEKNKIGTEIKQICKFRVTNKDFEKDCKLYIHKTNASSIYYITKEIEDDEMIDIMNDTRKWIKVQEKDEIPISASYIYCKYKVNKKYEELSTLFELQIKSNKYQNNISIETYAFIDNEKMNCFDIISRHISLWGKGTLIRILENPVYIGTLVQGKTTTVSYKNHTKIKLPESEWKVVKNAHDPIIDDEIWMKVLNRRGKKLRSSKPELVNCFSGILKCSYCGRTFVATKCGRSGDKNQKSYYVCSDRTTHFKNCINSAQLRKDQLETYALMEINKMIKKYKDDEEIKKIYDELITNKQEFNTKIDALNKEKTNLLKRKEKNQSYIKNLFESKVNGMIDTDEYFSFKNEYKEDINKIDERIKIIENEKELILLKRNELKTRKSIFRKYDTINELTYEIVHDFISEIKIGVKAKNGERTIEFLWNF